MRTGNPRKILVLNRNHIGDCLLTTPLLRALKRRFPRAKLEVSIPASNEDLLATNPHVDRIVPRPKLSSWAAKFRFALDIRAEEYDLIISLQEKSLFYAWATYYATLFNRNRPVTVGLDHPKTRTWYQHKVPVLADQHEVYKYLDIAALLGCPKERNPVLELVPPPLAQERIEDLLASRGVHPDERFIGVNPGGTQIEKRWPVERYAAVGDQLHERFGLPVLVFGGREDHDRASQIADRMKTHRPVIAAGRASLGETAALLERCQLLVTGDTGPMHMAVALAVPVVALFGPTDPRKYRPFTTLSAVLRHAEPCDECRVRRTEQRSRKRVSDDARSPEASAPCLHTVSVDECVAAAVKLYSVPPSRVRTDRGPQ